MARPVRLEFGGALYHVKTHGDRREAIHDDEVDREHFLEVLSQVVGQFNWCCHTYCLMSKHYHLVIATSDGTSRNGCANSRACSRSEAIDVTLFQRRYKAMLIATCSSWPATLR